MTVVITKPASGAVLKGIVAVEATFSGQNFDVATVSFGAQQVGSDSAQPIAFSVDTSKVTNGAKTLTIAVRYRGSGGRLRWQKASIPVTVNNVATPPPVGKPTVPSGLVATPGDGKVVLNWADNPASEVVEAYQVYVDDANFNLNVPASTFTVTGLTNGQSYSFRVSAWNDAGYGDWGNAVSATPVGVGVPPPPPPPPPPPSGTPFTNVNFAGGKYNGQGVSSVFVAWQSDPRVSDWGGLPPDLYDSRGCSQDQNARVHIIPNFMGRAFVSWQELRVSDSCWANPAVYPGTERLAKASLNISQAATHGGGYQVGSVRWYAWDFLLPLNIGGVSFEIPNRWFSFCDIHSNGGNADPGLLTLSHYGNSHPQWLEFASTSDTSSIPYINANCIQLTNADGSRIPSAYNVWHEWVLGIKYSPNSDGWVEVWFDGQQKLARTNRANVDPSESGPYVQLQNYTEYPTSYVGGASRSAVVYGGFRAGMNRTDVQTR